MRLRLTDILLAIVSPRSTFVLPANSTTIGSRLACLLFVVAFLILKPGNVDGRVHQEEPRDAGPIYQASVDPDQPSGLPYRRFFTRDKFDRQITFYLSKPKNDSELPLVVCIQGSGSQSLFSEIETPDGIRIATGGPEAVVLREAGDRVRVLIVEKPGVEFLVQPSSFGGAEEGSEEYNREFSLERWTEAINAATRAVGEMPGIDHSRILVLGHSEGGQVACEVAVAHDAVTHVAVMAGGGPTQLFDLLQQARSGDMYDPSATPEQRVSSLMADWQKVLDAPDATDQFIIGHTHLRWSSFLKTSPIEAILKTDANVFIAQGTRDTSTLPDSSEVLYTELLARGRDCTYERVDGGDHAFMSEGDTQGTGWFETNMKAVEWFLNDAR